MRMRRGRNTVLMLVMGPFILLFLGMLSSVWVEHTLPLDVADREVVYRLYFTGAAGDSFPESVHTPSSPSQANRSTISDQTKLVKTESLKPWLPAASNALPNYFTKRDITTEGSEYRNGVLIYVHHNKAAGSTTKACIKKISQVKKLRLSPVQSSERRVSMQSKFSLRGGQLYDMIMGGYAFGVCEVIQGRKCSYFTVLRDPYERLLSSYSYCRRAGMDQTCRGLSPWDVTLKDWAVHQGSYFFKQLLLKPWFCQADERTHPEFKNLTGIPHSKTTTLSNTPCWFREKVILQKSLTSEERDALIEYCVDHLEEWFSMIGLTDEYDLSLAMLEHIYGFPFHKRCSNSTAINLSNYKNLMENKIATNRTETTMELERDEDVYEALKGDILIYQKAKEIFKRQTTAFLNNL